MANPTTNFGWVMPTSTDLVTDLPADFAVFGQGVDTSMADLKGGTTGQVLSKASNTDMDFTWTADASGIPATIIDAKGDLIAGTAADTAARLAVGTNGQTLVADSTAATGLKWATASGGGKVLQVVTATYSTQTTTNSLSFVDTNLTASITPSANTSKIVVLVCIGYQAGNGSISQQAIQYQVLRGATQISKSALLGYTGSALYNSGQYSANVYDSPATTSATTYKVQMLANVNTCDVTSHYGSSTSSIILMEIGA
jgi:hypothetical protein